MVIYYFSGTGNSYHVTKAFQQYMKNTYDEDIAAIAVNAQFLKYKDHLLYTPSDQVIGFVFPTHNRSLPIPIQRLLERLTLPKTSYLFAVTTHVQDSSYVFRQLKTRLGPSKKQLQMEAAILMPDNNPGRQSFYVPTQDMLRHIEEVMYEKVAMLSEIVARRETYIDADIGGAKLGNTPKRWIGTLMSKSKGNDLFYVNSTCSNCGECVAVCPSEKLRLSGIGPEWKKDVTCYQCYACINACPKQAIQLKSRFYRPSYSVKNDRYEHPFMTDREMREHIGGR